MPRGDQREPKDRPKGAKGFQNEAQEASKSLTKRFRTESKNMQKLWEGCSKIDFGRPGNGPKGMKTREKGVAPPSPRSSLLPRLAPRFSFASLLAPRSFLALPHILHIAQHSSHITHRTSYQIPYLITKIIYEKDCCHLPLLSSFSQICFKKCF